jgi:phosphate transport system permease protein
MALSSPLTAAQQNADLVRASIARKRGDTAGTVFHWILIGGTALSLVILVTLVVDMWTEGSSVLTTRLGDFLTSDLASKAADAGVWQAIVGTVQLCLIVAVVAFPLGTAAAVYLEEYAGDSRFSRIAHVNIRNLAGVPSIVYGLLGLAIFVKWLGDNGAGGLTGGRSVISGGLTLAILVLPIVIITASEALKAVPAGIREGALAVGATKWETIRHHVIPSAAPGILTGTVLSLARAAGEAAPLILVGAVTGVFFVGEQGTIEQLFGRFTALPITIFSWARQPDPGFKALTGAAAIVLLVVIVLMNAVAIFLRNRYEKKW